MWVARVLGRREISAAHLRNSGATA